jgi:hypothetical protein
VNLAARVMAALLAAWGSVAGAQGVLGLVERAPIEATIPDPMPAQPAPDALVEFYVSPATTNRFAVDPASLGVDDGRLVRFTLVVTSRSGARNVSYEALRCDSGERRLLAVGRADGTWSISKNTLWQPVSLGEQVNRQMPELFGRVCDGGRSRVRNPQEFAARLKEAGRPSF